MAASAGLKPFERLLKLLKPDEKDIFAVVVIAAAIGTLSLSVPIAGQQLVRTVTFATLYQPIVILTMMILCVLAFMGALQLLQVYATELLQRRIFARLTSEMAYRLPRIDAHVWRTEFGPHAANRFFDIMTIQKVVAGLMVDGISVIMSTIIGMTVMAIYHPYLLGYSFILLLLMTGIIFGLGRGGVKSAVQESYAKYDTAAWLQTVAAHPTLFRHGVAPGFAMLTANDHCQEYLKHRAKHFKILARQFTAILGVQALATTSLLGLGGYLVINEQLSLGQLIAAELIAGMIVTSFAKMGKHIEAWYDLMAAVDKLGFIFDLPLEAPRAGQAGFSTAVSLTAERLLLSQSQTTTEVAASFHIHPGDKVAIVGPAASGKSHLLNTLFKNTAALGGYATVAGVDLRELDSSLLRQHMALLDGVSLINGTIEDNLRVGHGPLAFDQLNAVLARVGLLGEVRSLPDGTQTQLTANGAPLTQSQCVRLVIARAMLGAPAALLIDGLLDGLSDEQLDSILPELLGSHLPWTVVVATGRRQVAVACDRVIDLPSGDERAPHRKTMHLPQPQDDNDRRKTLGDRT